MTTTTKAFKLLRDRFEHKAGTTVYDFHFADYGTANLDSRVEGVEHTSVTLDPAGGYPSFTVPVHDLAPADAQESSSSEKTPVDVVAPVGHLITELQSMGFLPQVLETRRGYFAHQNGGRFLIHGAAPAINDDYPDHEADRHAFATVPDDCQAEGRRAAACWNACLGASTELLESMPDGFIGNTVPYHRMKASLQAAEKREIWMERAHTLHRKVEILYVVTGYQLTLTWDEEPISEAFEGETIAEAIDKAMAGFDLDARPQWKRDSVGRDMVERQMDALAAQRAELLATLQAVVHDFTQTADVTDAMFAAQQVLQKHQGT